LSEVDIEPSTTALPTSLTSDAVVSTIDPGAAKAPLSGIELAYFIIDFDAQHVVAKEQGDISMKRHCVLPGIVFLLCSALATGPYATAAIAPSPLVKLSALTGREIRNPQSDRMGQIEDIVIDAATGQIAYAVLSFGGFLGLGETWVVMPWGSLQTTDGGKTFTLNMSEEQLKNAPNFDPNQWPDMEDRHWGDTIHAYYGQPPYWGRRLPPTAAHETTEPPSFQLLRSSQALRQEVMNTRGQHIGQIEDIVIDAALGDIAYGVLSFGGFLGLGEKWFAIPWGAFEPSSGFGAMTLDVSEEALKKAPGFDKDQWPELANRRWATAAHDAFRQRPYWERRQQAQTAPETGDKTSQASGQETEKTIKQPAKSARVRKTSPAPVTVRNAHGTVLALIGPVTVSCQPQKAVAGDMPAMAQMHANAAETKRELVIKRQDSEIQIGCSQPAASQQDAPEASETQK